MDGYDLSALTVDDDPSGPPGHAAAPA